MHSLITDYKAFIADLLKEISHANTRVFISSFIFYADEDGMEVLKALQTKANAGVDVRVIYDAWPHPTKHEIRRQLKRSDIKFATYTWRSRLKTLIRYGSFSSVHSKVFIIDDRIGYIGGMNIGRRFRDWIDVMLKVQDVQEIEVFTQLFLEIWKVVKHRFPTSISELQTPYGTLLLRLPQRTSRDVRRWHIARFQSIQSSYTLLQQYFIAPHWWIEGLRATAERGVKITIILATRSDEPVLHWGMQHIIRQLSHRNITLYGVPRHLVHAKIQILDDTVIIGSSNIDYFSLYRAFELDYFLTDPSRVHDLKRLMSSIQNECVPFELGKLSWFQIFRNALAAKFRWFL